MSEKRFCLQCDDGTQLVHEARDLVFNYRDQTCTVPSVSGWHCPVCAECEFDAGEGQRYSMVVDSFAATVDTELAASMRAIRKKLGLKQAEAARLFGGGINAFSEYERGKTKPPRSTMVLLRLLDKHPELLAEIRS
jgi:HTH-type transcriptional regulator/antitoxin MqsA